MTLLEYTKLILEVRGGIRTTEYLKPAKVDDFGHYFESYFAPGFSFISMELLQKILPTQEIQDLFINLMGARGVKMTNDPSSLVIPDEDALGNFWNTLALFCEPLLMKSGEEKGGQDAKTV